MTKRNPKIKKGVKHKKRPRRLFKDKKGFYYLDKSNKKRYIKVPANVSQKQIVNVNIKNVIPIPIRKRQKKRRNPRLGRKVAGPLVPGQQQGLPFFKIQPIDRRLKNVEEQKKDLDDAAKKAVGMVL